MKLASFLTLASLAVSSAFAQSIQIGSPLPNTPIKPGCNITVTVIRPVSLQNSVVFALALK